MKYVVVLVWKKMYSHFSGVHEYLELDASLSLSEEMYSHSSGVNEYLGVNTSMSLIDKNIFAFLRRK